MREYKEKILEIINDSNDHLTAEQIFQKVRAYYPQIVLATVYNNINKLAAQGAIRRISLEGCLDRYDKATRHDHLICGYCSKLSDVTLDNLTEQLEAELGQKILSYDLRIQYICPECKGKE